MPIFDDKFGADLLDQVPSLPGVYFYRDHTDTVIYVGKSNNLKRRLTGYRKTTRRKRYAKMRAIVRAASSLTWEICESDAAALLREDALIKELRPEWNEAGAFFASYPAIGIRSRVAGDLELCLVPSYSAAELASLGFSLHGTFRDRLLTSSAYEALDAAFTLLGHPEKNLRKRYVGLPRGTTLAAYRQVDARWSDLLNAFLGGARDCLLVELAESLLEKSMARRKASEVEDALKTLRKFFKTEPKALADAKKRGLIASAFVPGEDRDRLNILKAQSA